MSAQPAERANEIGRERRFRRLGSRSVRGVFMIGASHRIVLGKSASQT
jgi:hypothetical protein